MDTILANSESKPLVGPTDQATPSSSSLGLLERLQIIRQPPPQLEHANYPNVQMWFSDDYNGRRKTGKAAEGEKLEDESKETSKSSILSSYMEDESGKVVHETSRAAVRAHAKAFFCHLLKNGRAPARWREASLDVVNELVYELETNFPWLQLCEGHWKAKQVATNSYSQWLPSALLRLKNDKARMGTGSQSPDIEVIDVDAVEPHRRKALKRRVVDEDGAGPSKRPHLEEAPSGVQPGKPTTNHRRVCKPYHSNRSIRY